MKRRIKYTSFVLAVLALLTFCGCGGEKNTELSDSFDLSSLHDPVKEGADNVAGAWKITEGTGSQLKSFTFMFDGKGKANLVIDNMVYVENYTLDGDTFSAKMLFGINGTYTYTLDDGRLTLKNKDDGSVSVLEPREDFSYIPEPKEDFNLDERILGAWKSEEGMYLYFSTDGIMYENSYGISFTFSNYSVSGDEITSSYKMSKEITNTLQFSVDGEILTVDGFDYQKIDTSELI